MKEDLLRCPFCGGKPILFYIPENDEEEMQKHPKWEWNNPGMWTIGCENNSCIITVQSVPKIFTNKETAIKEWNKRV